MVLRISLCLWLVVVTSSAWAYDPTAYGQAVALHSKNKNAKALEKLEEGYNFGDSAVPLKVSSWAAILALSLKEWKKAESIADRALRANWENWPPADPSQPDVVVKLKHKPNLFPSLIKSAAEAKSQRLVSTAEELSDAQQLKLKNELKLYADVLAQVDSNSEHTQALLTRVQDHEELALREEYKLNLAGSLSYMTWEDRSGFDHDSNAHTMEYTPCLGLAANYSNAFFQWSLGGCAGVGRADVLFSDGHYDNHASLTMVAGYASALVQLSDAGAAFGLEADVLNFTLKAKGSDGSNITSTDMEMAMMAVGRFRFSKLDVKFKGGTNLNSQGGIWELELAYPLYQFF